MNKTLLVGGIGVVLVASVAGFTLKDKVLVKGISMNISPTLEPTLQPTAIPTLTPTNTPIPTVKIWPTFTPKPTIAPTSKPQPTTITHTDGNIKSQTTICVDGVCPASNDPGVVSHHSGEDSSSGTGNVQGHSN